MFFRHRQFVFLAYCIKRKELLAIAREAMGYLTSYNYPGNIRELLNIFERATVLMHGAMITPSDLPCDLTSDASGLEFAGERLADAVS